MLLTGENSVGWTFYDYMGTELTHVVDYNTSTREFTLLLLAWPRPNSGVSAKPVYAEGDGGTSTPVYVKVKLPGSYAKDPSGKRI